MEPSLSAAKGGNPMTTEGLQFDMLRADDIRNKQAA
jgi:hypothetical protein